MSAQLENPRQRRHLRLRDGAAVLEQLRALRPCLDEWIEAGLVYYKHGRCTDFVKIIEASLSEASFNYNREQVKRDLQIAHSALYSYYTLKALNETVNMERKRYLQERASSFCSFTVTERMQREFSIQPSCTEVLRNAMRRNDREQNEECRNNQRCNHRNLRTQASEVPHETLRRRRHHPYSLMSENTTNVAREPSSTPRHRCNASCNATDVAPPSAQPHHSRKKISPTSSSSTPRCHCCNGSQTDVAPGSMTRAQAHHDSSLSSTPRCRCCNGSHQDDNVGQKYRHQKEEDESESD